MNTKLKIPRGRKAASLDARKARAGYVFVAPFIIGIILIYVPILIDSIWFSFFTLQPIAGGVVVTPVGFTYYQEALTNSQLGFTDALLESLQELVFQVPAIIIFSLFIAVVLNQKMLGRAVFRAIFFIPVIISTGLMETINAQASSMEQDQIEGGAGDGSEIEEDASNQIISTMDIEALFAMMKIGGQIIPTIVNLVNDIYNIINYSGVQMLIFLAGLQSVSPAIYEACTIDGATGWETFWKVTFPMISPMILVNAVYTIIDAFTRQQSVMMKFLNEASFNNGSPAGDAQVSAMSWIYFIVVILILAVVAGIASSFIFYQKRD